MAPGHTRRVRTDADRVVLLQRLGDYLRFFRERAARPLVTPQVLKAVLEQLASGHPGGKPIDWSRATALTTRSRGVRPARVCLSTDPAHCCRSEMGGRAKLLMCRGRP